MHIDFTVRCTAWLSEHTHWWAWLETHGSLYLNSPMIQHMLHRASQGAC